MSQLWFARECIKARVREFVDNISRINFRFTPGEAPCPSLTPPRSSRSCETGTPALSMNDSKFQELVRRRLLGSVSGKGTSQKVVSVGEVERYLSEGWGFVSTLPNRRAVLTPPDFGRKMNY